MRTITELEVMSIYLKAIMGKAQHHAGNIEHIALTLAGAVIWKKKGEVKVYEREGDMKNIIWFPVNGIIYVLKYNHHNQTIELRKETHVGELITTFDNKSSPQSVLNTFNKL